MEPERLRTLAVLELCVLDILGKLAVSMFVRGEALDDKDHWIRPTSLDVDALLCCPISLCSFSAFPFVRASTAWCIQAPLGRLFKSNDGKQHHNT